jgi:alkanesulfonate monooxygenase SsuD/methylene tetrahydromethanopterin reductase-like flavin-dependent oxidoreductase (luciferase family)
MSVSAGLQTDIARPDVRTMSVGVNVPIVDGTGPGGAPRWADAVAFAQEAESLGFDSLWVPDHLLMEWEGVKKGSWEGWSILAALAAATNRIQLGPLVACTAFRNPALLAKMADTVDEISGGRLILGLGAGWKGSEYRAFGYPTDRPVSRFEEALQIIVPLLKVGHVDFEGQFYEARDCELRPRGPRTAGPPILIGGKGPRVIRLAATYADIWNAEGPLRSPSELAPIQEDGDLACQDVRREHRLDRSAAVFFRVASEGGSDETNREGAPDSIREQLRGYAAGGLDHVQVWLEPHTIEGLRAFAPALELVKRNQQ